MMRWLDVIVDWILDLVSPIDDEELTARYRMLGTRFLLTSTDREVRRMAALVREGRAPPLTESSGSMFWTSEEITAAVDNMAAAISASMAIPIGIAITDRLTEAIQAANRDAR